MQSYLFHFANQRHSKHHSRRHFSTGLISWIMICALLLASLAPVLKHSIGAGAGWVEMCSAAGNKWIKLDARGQIIDKAGSPYAGSPDAGSPDAGSPDAGSKQNHGGHCALCTQDHDPGLALPVAVNAQYHINLALGHPPLFYQAPQGLFVWRPQQSRAPPQVT